MMVLEEKIMPRRNRRKPTTIAIDAEARAEELAAGIIRNPVLAADGTVLRDAVVEQAQWDDPDDLNYRSKRVWQVRGYRRVSVIRNLHLRRGLITKEHLDAADRLVLDFEMSNGARPGYERPEAGTAGAFAEPGQRQLDAVQRYREAVQAVGLRLCAVLLPVVLCNASLADVAGRGGMDSHVAHGFLLAALDRLVEHYEELGEPQRQSA